MTDISKLRELLARVERATWPSEQLHAEIICALFAADGCEVQQSQINGAWCIYEPTSKKDKPWRLWEKYPRDLYGTNVTASIDAAVALCERVLPGWAWSVCRCCVSDDARVWPDYNCPEHGERLKREFPLPAERYLETNARGSTELTWGPFDEGFDIDRRPPGNVALALCEAILQAKLYIAEQAEA